MKRKKNKGKKIRYNMVKIKKTIRFERKISKMKDIYYISIPVTYIRDGWLEHGKKYIVKLEPIEEKGDN